MTPTATPTSGWSGSAGTSSSAFLIATASPSSTTTTAAATSTSSSRRNRRTAEPPSRPLTQRAPVNRTPFTFKPAVAPGSVFLLLFRRVARGVVCAVARGVLEGIGLVLGRVLDRFGLVFAFVLHGRRLVRRIRLDILGLILRSGGDVVGYVLGVRFDIFGRIVLRVLFAGSQGCKTERNCERR